MNGNKLLSAFANERTYQPVDGKITFSNVLSEAQLKNSTINQEYLGLISKVFLNKVLANYIAKKLYKSPSDEVTKEELRSIKRVNYSRTGAMGFPAIMDLIDMQHLTELESLDISSHQVREISPLSELTKLKYIYTPKNQIINL